MIIGIGCDIVDHDLTTILNGKNDSHFLHRVFSDKELVLYEKQKNIKFITGRFAAKEAVLKCLGIGMEDGISLKDIEILQSPGGKASVVVKGVAKKVSDAMGIDLWHLSITHSNTCSVAFIVAEKKRATN